MTTRVKICGITNEQDALWVSNLGADFIGLNFYKDSERKISLDMAEKIVNGLPAFIKTVGVFVDEDVKKLKKIATKCRLSMVQLHGNESPEYCAEIHAIQGELKIIKAFRIQDESSLERINAYAGFSDYYLLDAYVPDQLGGTGQTFNWDLAVKAKALGKPLFLSGGLTPDNVQEAIEKVKPFAVDVASGIEKTARRKDYDKMKDFIQKARGF
jgi:phosphoribosylanthranilate isomerase